jgi:hypothetical protein
MRHVICPPLFCLGGSHEERSESSVTPKLTLYLDLILLINKRIMRLVSLCSLFLNTLIYIIYFLPCSSSCSTYEK